MKTTFLLIVVIIITVWLYSCDSTMVQSINSPSLNKPTVLEISDTVVREYNNGLDFLGSYYQNLYPGLRIDSAEVIDSANHCLRSGFLIIYFNNRYIDSIQYGLAYHYPGVTRPFTTSGYILQDKYLQDKYLLRVQNERSELYIAGKSIWYFINNHSITKLPKVASKTENGIYENNSVNVDNVRKANNKIIFYGSYYCLRETYCTFNFNSVFKNYCRIRPDCYSSWQWE